MGTIAPRRLFPLLLMGAFAACGDGPSGRTQTAEPPPAAATTAAGRQASAADLRAQAGEPLPPWARESPHFFERGGRRYAAAVGRARTGSLALARMTAQDRARAQLLRLVQNRPGPGLAEGPLAGARTTDVFTSRKGTVYARVEMEAEL